MNRVYSSRKSEGDENTAVNCRARRRRRMAKRMALVSAEGEGKHKCARKTMTTTNMETPSPPVYGSISVIGRRRQMDNKISVRTNLCQPEINRFQPVHFFGVFDGQVSGLCKEYMNVIMEEELMRVKAVGDGDRGELWRSVINRSFQRVTEMALKSCSYSYRYNSQRGSTAMVSILTEEYMIVASCGDACAVLCREGKPIMLHKADEGGYYGRIMSRPIDDVSFLATSEPGISITKREETDECLILGSNGLWDVVSSDLACETVHECLTKNEKPIVEPRGEAIARTEMTATILVRLAMGRRSADNISVIVIDLRK